MHNQYAIVILNHFPEYAQKLLHSIRLTHKAFPSVVVVCDRHQEKFEGVDTIETEDDFIYARNSNRGVNHFPSQDIILCNDDMECVQDNFFDKLCSIVWKYPKCGLMSPLIDGGVGNPLQQYPPIEQWKEISVETIATKGPLPICFPCVYIKRNLINEIGLLDENFTGYGFDDDDYCIRTRNAGYWTMITKSLHIKHGEGGTHLHRGYNWSCSFAKFLPRPSNYEYFLQKHSATK